MERVSSRHEGDASGILSPFSEVTPVDVTVEIEPEFANQASVQHTAWMIVNLLARLEGVVARVGILADEQVFQAGRIVPLGTPSTNFMEALLRGAAAIGVVPVSDGKLPDSVCISVGPGSANGAWLRAHGNGWTGGIAPGVYEGAADSPLPFGPYISACMAVAEVFKLVRMSPEMRSEIQHVTYSAWEHTVGAATDSGPSVIGDLQIDCTLAGVGAVGSAWLHAIWALDCLTGQVILSDNDQKGVDVTNINRYSFFGKTSIGQPKATEAARTASASPIVWLPNDVGIERISARHGLLVSAVDRNSVRQAIQCLYPDRILSGSTNDLRAEIMRCGPPGVGACLGCFNPLETAAPDSEMQAQLRQDPELALEVSKSLHISVAEVHAWAQNATCGETGDRILGYLRHADDGPDRFAVGFVSVMAGALLAAETIKELLHSPLPLNDIRNRATFQFVTPASPWNGSKPYRREEQCTLCAPGTDAHRIWTKRFQSHAPRG
ncbi:ThiF family adenylyltransferase [Capsulimonas corticalis]|uniref:ThiF family adenylyltransferase n=1 Tax=Capsulimonas corticalis TaxID=2219043 RepID=UPI000E6505D4|nr:ThiF family adenylyltransferase [Capsulimonas corticalis]